ncbi:MULTISPECIES: ABC transporter ATP-binding protein [Bacillus]|uniref:ABC transporter ATP-binding protein n=1 Tax=Bacillus TaxID=1386 RepID=UPI000BEDFFD4|nr:MULTISPECIES: ABC transporter ATP-binding protein [Bacillus]MCX2828742.1 ABC transporter ATP-binding protein [Bacillus sp. DHT2]MDR4916780.1 ABC transporter ATP-binding protein [Bacillus pseudomycoides]PEB41949.1 multidrug ABC transporter ATP-binding protein [Bacillus pseudomycoides]PGD90797.1 multidrug ABC transporter ATP-binding protein [Bacillus pseudomycoides]PGD95785.1 multidrug ABC transporter ATP-binding protein [Bacillus pseudomycoides]
MTVLQIDGICKQYKKKTALFPTSLHGRDGECIVLCGGNGAGKSTILNILAGISSPTSGTVRLQDIELRENRRRYVAEIGYMPDDFHAQQSMTVQEFLSFYAAFRKVGKERVQEVIALLGLEEKQSECLHRLSKGMRQRLLFGQAWLAKPKLLLLDEPTNGLDPYWVNEFVTLLKDIKRSGTIIVFSTHMMDVAADIGDVILFMEDGKITQEIRDDGNTENLILQLLQLHRK